MFHTIFHGGRMFLVASVLFSQLSLGETTTDPRLSITAITSRFRSELESRLDSLEKKLSNPQPLKADNLKVSAGMVTYPRNAKTISDIRLALEYRKSLNASAIIPTDPFHRVNREHQLAKSECQLAWMWWKHCQNQPNYRPLTLWESLYVWSSLSSELMRTSNQLVAFIPKQDADQSPGTIKLPPMLAERLKRSGSGRKSVLDRVSGWNQLSTEEKSKLIVR